jgi:hypothetical protein
MDLRAPKDMFRPAPGMRSLTRQGPHAASIRQESHSLSEGEMGPLRRHLRESRPFVVPAGFRLVIQAFCHHPAQPGTPTPLIRVCQGSAVGGEDVL